MKKINILINRVPLLLLNYAEIAFLLRYSKSSLNDTSVTTGKWTNKLIVNGFGNHHIHILNLHA